MQKPKNTIYGTRILCASAIVSTVAIAYLAFGQVGGNFGFELAVAFLLPILGWFYLVFLLSRGRFWVRSIFLALTIINCLQVLLSMSSTGGLLGVLLLILNVFALYFLYRKDSNAWFADILMEETLKRQQKYRKY